MSPFYRTLSPIVAAAQKGKKRKMRRRGRRWRSKRSKRLKRKRRMEKQEKVRKTIFANHQSPWKQTKTKWRKDRAAREECNERGVEDEDKDEDKDEDEDEDEGSQRVTQ